MRMIPSDTPLGLPVEYRFLDFPQSTDKSLIFSRVDVLVGDGRILKNTVCVVVMNELQRLIAALNF